MFAVLLTSVATPGILWLAHRFRWYDVPDERKIHTGNIPRLGGIGIFVSFLVTVLLASMVFGFMGVQGVWPPGREVLFVLSGMAVIFTTGLLDDFRNLRAIVKLVLQILAAVLVTLGGFLIRSIPLPFLGSLHLGILAYPVTVLWIVGITNALNLIDGIDGFAGGIAAIGALFLGLLAGNGDWSQMPGIPFILCGAICGFLFYNFPPARLFMGDSGALFLGFTLSVIPLMQFPETLPVTSLVVPVTILTIPVLDTASAIVRRTMRGLPFYSPDREHIHHKLQNLGLGDRKILGITYSYCTFLGFMCLLARRIASGIGFLMLLCVWLLSLLCYFALKGRGPRKNAG